MKMKRVLTALLASAMIITNSVNVFAAENNEYGGFEVADRVVIGDKERNVDLVVGEGILYTGYNADYKAKGYAVTRVYSGKYNLEAMVSCIDQFDIIISSPVAMATNATTLRSEIISPKSSLGGEFIGQHKITSPVTGESHSGGTGAVVG